MIEHQLEQGSPEWLAHRTKYFNASDAPAMLGISKYKTRTELLHEYHTGISKSVSQSTQKLFDDGHRFEALARPIAESIIGEDLYPVVGTEGIYGASFDGLNLTQDINWENKTLNDDIRAAKTVDDLDEMYLVQMEQQHMVSNAEKTLFTGTKFDAQGELLEKKEFWYTPNAERRQRIIDGWAQFKIDLDNYVPVEVIEKPKAKQIMALPSLAIQIRGEVTLSNLPEFAEAATAYIESIKTEFVTDEDFANGEATVKFCEDAEKNIELTQAAAIAQTASIDELMRTLDHIKAQLRDKRLLIKKLVVAEKDKRKFEIVDKARAEFVAHVESHLPTRLIVNIPDFQSGTRNKKTLSSMIEAVNLILVNSKIEVDALAREIAKKQAWFDDFAKDHLSLFPDLQTVIYKPMYDFKLLVESRINAEKAKQAEHEARIKAQAEEVARAKVLAEQEAQRKAELQAKESATASQTNAVEVPVSTDTKTTPPPELEAQFGKVFVDAADGPDKTVILNKARPTDDQIINALSLAFRVHESKIVEWLLEMDLEAASLKLAA